MIVLIFLALSVIIRLIVIVLAMVGSFGKEALQMLMLAVFLPPAIVLSIRITLLWPTLADREGTIRTTFTDAILLTRVHALKIAGLLIAFVMLYLLSVAVIESAIGSVLLILMRDARRTSACANRCWSSWWRPSTRST